MPLALLRRRWRWAVAPAFACLVAAVVAAQLLPDVYVSTALVQLEAARVSPRLVANFPQSRWNDLLGGFRNLVLSRPALSAVIQNHRLYESERGRVPLEDLVERLRQAVTFDPVGSPPAFRVSVAYHDRFVAQRVATDLVSRLMDQGLRRSSDDARFTERFLARQHEEAAEAARTATAALDDAMRSNDRRGEAIDRQREQRRDLGAALADLRRERESMLRAEPVAPAPPVRRESPPAPTISPERAALLRERAALLSRYTSAHPDVKAIEARIALLPPDPAPPVRIAEPVPEPTRRDNGPLLAENARRITEIEQRIAHLEAPPPAAAITDLRRRADAATRRESELKAKLDEARMAMSVHDDRLGESLEVVETASLPETPVAPQRALIVLGGWVLGLVAGAAFAVARENFDGAIGSIATLSGQLKLPVLAAVPLLEDGYAAHMRLRRSVIGWTTFFAAGLAAMAAAMLQRRLSR